MSTEIRNTKGELVTTVSNTSVDTTTSKLTYWGRGLTGFGQYMMQNLHRLLENFSNTTAPSPAIKGQIWHDESANGGMKFYNGSEWVNFVTGSNTSGFLLSRLSGADNIDLSSTGGTDIYTAAADTSTFILGVLLIPRSGAAPTGRVPSFQMEITADTGDVSEETVLAGLDAAGKFAYYPISGVQRIVDGGETVSFNVKRAIGGGTLAVDVYLFGHIRGA
jgi:hypothetical protein